MKPTLLIYGNCQAGALAVIFGSDPTLASAFDVKYIASFDDRTPGKAAITDEAIEATDVLFEQHDPITFPFRERLPQDCLTITFPSIDWNLLWPLNCVNAFNDEPSPEFPWGSFPYGDRIIVDCVRRGLSVEETLDHYDAVSAEQLPNLDRFAALEVARLAARDAKCTITMGDYIASRFREENLFWTVNHPTMEPLRELSHRLIAQASKSSSTFASVAIDETIATLPPQGPLGDFRIPVHPKIAEHFDLTWYPDASSAQYGHRSKPLTYREYLLAMTKCAVRTREAERLGFRDQTRTLMQEAPNEPIAFVCNLCGAPSSSLSIDNLHREGGACPACGATVLGRALTHLASMAFYRRSVPARSGPTARKTVYGISHRPGFADYLRSAFTYVTTQFDRDAAPDAMFFDICQPPPELVGTADAVTCSDILERVPPPVQRVFHGLFALLKPGGTLIFTVPYSLGETREYFPQLHEWALEEIDGQRVLKNRTAQGEEQVFGDLRFRGRGDAGPEMRVFGLKNLIARLMEAGFEAIEVMTNDVVGFGIHLDPWSRPIRARRPL